MTELNTFRGFTRDLISTAFRFRPDIFLDTSTQCRFCWERTYVRGDSTSHCQLRDGHIGAHEFGDGLHWPLTAVELIKLRLNDHISAKEYELLLLYVQSN